MKIKPEKPKRRAWLRLGYGVLGPLATVLALYLFVFLAANSHVGSNWIKEQVNRALPGSLEFEYVEIQPSLSRVHAWGVRLFDPTGQPVLEVRRLECSIDLSGMLFNRFDLSRCTAENGRVLVGVKPEGHLGIVRTFSPEVRAKRPLDQQPVLVFDGVTLRDVDVLVNLNDLMLRFDDVTTDHAFISVDENGFFMKTDRLHATGGRWFFSERLLGFGPGKSNLATLAWSTLRMLDPWKAAYTDFPQPAEGTRGALDLPLHWFDLEGFVWEREAIRFDKGLIRAADVTIAGAAWVEFIPEQPTLAPGEAGVISYDGSAMVHLTPDSPVLDFILPGMISTAEQGVAEAAMKPFYFDGYGNIRIFDGSTEVHARDLSVLGWHLESLDGNLAIRAGRLGFDGVASAQLWDGEVSGTGWIEPSNGAWAAKMCLRNVYLPRFLGAFPPMGLPYDVSHARLSTRPSRCSDTSDSPIEMSGNLTSKALLQMAPARETRANNFLEDTMWRMDIDGLFIDWDRKPSGVPDQSMLLSGSGRLDQRGFVHVPAERGSRPFIVRSGQDQARFEGVIDVIEGLLPEATVRLHVDETSRWAAEYGLPRFPIGVEMNATLNLSGSAFNPVLERARLSAERLLSDRSSPPFSAELELHREGRSHRIDTLAGTSPAGSFEVDGSLRLFGDGMLSVASEPSVEVEAHARDIRLDLLPFDLPISTTVTEFDGSWSGLLRSPDARATLSTSEGFIAGEPFQSIHTSIAWDGRTFAVDEMEFSKGDGVVSGSLSLDTVSNEIDGEVRSDEFRLSDLQTLIASGLSPSGLARFSLNVSGTITRPDIFGSVVVERLRLLDRRIGNTSFVVDTWDGAVHADGTFNGLLDTDLVFEHGSNEIRLLSSFHRLPLGRLLPALDGGFARSWLSGEMDTRVTLGSSISVETLVELTAAELDAGERYFHLKEPAHGTVALDAGGYMFTIEPLTISDGVRELHAEGMRNRDGSVEASVRGDVDLALLQLFPDLIADSSGDARVDIKIGGTGEELRAEGTVDLDDVAITPRGLGTTLRLDGGLIELRGDEVVVSENEPLRGEIYGGDLIMSGAVAFDGLTPGKLVLDTRFSGATYRIPDQLVMTLNGDLQIANDDLMTPLGWSVAGALEIVDGRFFRDFDIFSDIFSIGGIGRTVGLFEVPIWIKNPDIGSIDLDLSVTGRDRFFVVSNISSVELDLEMRTDLSIRGPLAAMDIEGEMETLEDSRVLYSGRRFDVEDGVLLFTGYRDEQGIPFPLVDMEMETEIRSTCASRRRGTLDTTNSDDIVGQRVEESESIFITMDIEGRLPVDLTFALESTPFYDQRDQLSLILTGCPVDALTGGSGAGPTLEIVFRPVIDIVERNVESRFNLDDVDLVPTPEGSAEILVEDEISERLIWTLNARVGTDEESEQTITGRYSLFDWMILELLEETGRGDPLTIDGGVRFRVRLN